MPLTESTFQALPDGAGFRFRNDITATYLTKLDVDWAIDEDRLYVPYDDVSEIKDDGVVILKANIDIPFGRGEPNARVWVDEFDGHSAPKPELTASERVKAALADWYAAASDHAQRNNSETVSAIELAGTDLAYLLDELLPTLG